MANQAIILSNPKTKATSTITIPTKRIAEMAELFHLMAENHAVSPMQRLETSGLRLAQMAQMLLSDFADDEIEDRPIAVLAGLDQAGAVGLIAARHLEAWGAWVQVVTTHPLEAYQAESGTVDQAIPATTSPETDQAMTALLAEGVATAWAEDGWELPPADLIIDAMQTNPSYDLIQLVNSHHAPVLSLGIPAGLDPDTGARSGPYLSVAATLTLGLPAVALSNASIKAICGTLYLADVGIPHELYAQVGLDKAALFGEETIILIE